MLVTSLTQRLDYYKLTMAQFAHVYYPDVMVEYSLVNRTKSVNLLDWIDPEELQRELDHASTLRFDRDELKFMAERSLSDRKVFRADFIQSLRHLHLPEMQVVTVDGHVDVVVKEKWPVAIYCETIVLSVVNQMYFQALMDAGMIDAETLFWEGKFRLDRKIDKLIAAGIGRKIIEFGTRRALADLWLDFVDDHFNDRAPGVFGTYAHEMDMVLAALADSDEEMLAAHERLLDQWWELYGYDLSIALSDTFGSKHFFATFGKERAAKWKGVRHDSGDAFEFGEMFITFCLSNGIDPKEKWIIFSDGLDVDMIIALNQRFAGRINIAFGWGTNLTCDIGFPTISLVMKAIAANGRKCVKLSDNLRKAIGPKAEIDHYVKVYGYDNRAEAVCVY